VLLFASLERRQDLPDQLARGGRGELDRDALAAAVGLIDEIDAERVLERRV